jgi:glucosyl-3-phosphoglycerate phosphatase
MTHLLIWRHGQTPWNALTRMQGQIDIDLDDVGRAQAASASSELAARKPQLIVSSDLSRASSTARALAERCGLPVELDKRLRERDFGPWQGLLPTEMHERNPAEFEAWRRTEEPGLDGIETVPELASRAAAAMEDAAARVGTGTAVVVTHGGAARAGAARLLGWPAGQGQTLKVLLNCHWTELRRTPLGWQLYAHNVR